MQVSEGCSRETARPGWRRGKFATTRGDKRFLTRISYARKRARVDRGRSTIPDTDTETQSQLAKLVQILGVQTEKVWYNGTRKEHRHAKILEVGTDVPGTRT